MCDSIALEGGESLIDDDPDQSIDLDCPTIDVYCCCCRCYRSIHYCCWCWWCWKDQAIRNVCCMDAEIARQGQTGGNHSSTSGQAERKPLIVIIVAVVVVSLLLLLIHCYCCRCWCFVACAGAIVAATGLELWVIIDAADIDNRRCRWSVLCCQSQEPKK